jgi:hypothetical protein
MTNKNIADMSIDELTTAALNTSNRQYSICCTRMAAAKQALAMGDRDSAKLYLDASKRAWLRSQEDERSQFGRVLATQSVVVERGAAQTVNRKVCATAPMRTAHVVAWNPLASDR